MADEAAARALVEGLRPLGVAGWIVVTFDLDGNPEGLFSSGDTDMQAARIARIADRAFEREINVRTCRVCGCSDSDACQGDYGPCAWVEDDLCSVCAMEMEPIPDAPEPQSLTLRG